MAELYALVAQFRTPDALLAATRAARQKGYVSIEAFSPFPVDGLAQALGFREMRIAPIMLAGGVLGLLGGAAMQAYVALAFPLNVGGRPLISWPAYALICFELLVLGAVCAGILAMLVFNRLPKLHHPMFDLANFHLASDDRFFLAIRADDPKFDRATARRFLNTLDPVSIEAEP